MYKQDNIFAKILKKELPAKVIYEDNDVLAFHDAYPVAPIHAIVVPKGQYVDYADFVQNSAPEIVGNFFVKVEHVAKILGAESYRLLTNKGGDSGQTIFHFHVHIIGGKQINRLI